MGIESILGAVAGPVIGGLLGSSGSKQTSTATTTQQNQLSPQMQAMLFGDGTSSNPGILSQYQDLMNKPEDANLLNYGNANLNYLNSNGASNLTSATGAANSLIGGTTAPTSTAANTSAASTSVPSYDVGNQVQAPSQNGINLTDSYNSLLSGGDTTALNNSMNAAVNATNAGFNTNLTTLTNQLQRNILPGIGSNAVLAGQYGGSRQGVAQADAISDYTNQATQAASQLAATNSANTTAQAASAYQQGQDRALSATQGLGAQQYGVASQNATTANNAEFQNVQNQVNAANTNAGYNEQSMLANAGYNQQTNLANQQAQLGTNSLNSANLASGANLLGGLSSQAYGVGQGQNNYQLNQYGAINSLLSPYLGADSSSTSSQPIYQNTMGNFLGGALGVNTLLNGKNNNGILSMFGNNTTMGGNYGGTYS